MVAAVLKLPVRRRLWLVEFLRAVSMNGEKTGRKTLGSEVEGGICCKGIQQMQSKCYHGPDSFMYG